MALDLEALVVAEYVLADEYPVPATDLTIRFRLIPDGHYRRVVGYCTDAAMTTRSCSAHRTSG